MTHTCSGWQRLSRLLPEILVAICLLAPSALCQTYLKVISYNIHGMAPGSDAPTRLVHIIENFKQLDPDIVGLQEINETRGGDGSDNQGRAIADSLSSHFGRPYYYNEVETQFAWDGAYLQFNGIISKYPIVDSGFTDLPTSDFPRKVVWASIETEVGTVNFFNTHLSGDIGAEQVQVILQFIRAHEQANPAAASLLTGDFNSTPQSDAVQMLIGDQSDTTFADTYADANPSSPGYTVPAGDASSRIDYVFFGRAGDFDISASEIVFDTPYAAGQYCSDHYGVMTTFVGKLNRRLSVTGSGDFPSLLPGMHYNKTLTVTSVGNVPVDVLSIANNSSAYQISGLPQLPVTLTRGGPVLTMTIAFAPNAAGSFEDSIIIASNDSVEPYREVALRGRCLAAIAPALSGKMYAASFHGVNGTLYAVDPASGVADTIGAMRIPGVHSLTIQPSTHELYGSFANSDGSWLYRITASTGDAIPTSFLSAGDIRAIAFGSDNALYGATTSGGFCQINMEDGTITPVGVPFKYGFAGICMNPAGEVLWACVKNKIDSTYQINPLTGEVRYVGVTGFSAFTRSLAFGIDGTLYALIDNGYGTTYIATLDTLTASGLTAYPTGVDGLTAMAMSSESGSSAPRAVPSNLPAKFSLEQNYPNPFNPITTIKYTVEEIRSQVSDVSEVQIVIYDVLGREVDRLVNARQAPGNYEVKFDGTQLASGVYFYRLTAGKYMATKAMLLEK